MHVFCTISLTDPYLHSPSQLILNPQRERERESYIMKRELASVLDAQSQLTELLGRTRSTNPNVSNSITDQTLQSMAHVITNRSNNGVVVYTRNKRFKSSKSDGISVNSDEPNKIFVKTVEEDGVADMVNLDNSKGNLGTKMSEGKVKEETTYTVKFSRRVTLSAVTLKGPKGKMKSEYANLGGQNGNLGVRNGSDKVVLGESGEVGGGLGGESGGTGSKKMEMKMSKKKINVKRRPATVRELFETGLLEGYPVFYNGGKRGIPLQGTIKDIGILCSCSLCKGSRVVAPCHFEIHASKSYRRASQYICFENGKSLLDVVKECRKSSLKTLEETIQCIVGPLPLKESVICRNCKGSFLGAHVSKVEQLCDSCLISVKSEASPNTTGTKTRAKKPALALKSSGSSSMDITSQKRSQSKMRIKSSEPAFDTNSSPSASVLISPKSNSHRKILTKSSEAAFVPKSNASASALISPAKNSQGKILTKLSNSVSIPRSLKIASLSLYPQNKSKWKITKKDQRMHKLVFEDGGLPEGTALAYYSRGKRLLNGYKKGSGIFCCCCNTEVSPSQFEAHAGWASRKKPYGYIYTSNGVSLHELAISLLKGRNHSSKDNDDLCIICADGGRLVLCDGCPRAFHRECASLSSIPRGKWYCKYCQNMFQRERFVEHNANAVAAGRVSGVDPIEQITLRCIRIVKSPEDAEVIACVLCRGFDFSKSGFGPRTVIVCDQCEKEYHVGCLKKHKLADLKELPKGKWFCRMECRRIYSALQNLLICGAEKLPDSLLDVMRKKHMEKGSDSVTDFDVRWRLLSGKITSRETRLFLSEAVAIFHDCFDPIVDSATGRDFIPSMVYGRNIRGQDFGGMYCAILTVNSSVVSAAIIRVFGQDMAELPLVATCNGNQGKGYFQLLFSCIEKFLAFLNVRIMVLPAAVEAESIWTDKFGFKEISTEQLSNYRKTCWQMITFKGTSMLEKMVPQRRILRQEAADFDACIE